MNGKRFTRIALFVSILGLASWPGSRLAGQAKHIARSNQQWLQYYNQTKLSSHWTLLFDGGFRWKEAFRHRSQYLARLGFGYRLSGDVNLAAGMAYFGFFRSAHLHRIEYRPHQEVSFRQAFGTSEVSHRFRLEERFLRQVIDGKVSGPVSFNFRIRYRLAWNIPLFVLSRTHRDRLLALNLADEIFLNAGRQVIYNVFDQNRILIGLVARPLENVSISATYQSQFSAANALAEFTHLDVIWIGLTHRIDLSKK